MTQLISVTTDNYNFIYINESNNIAYVTDTLKNVKENSTDVSSVYYGLSNKNLLMYLDKELPAKYEPTTRLWYHSHIMF